MNPRMNTNMTVYAMVGYTGKMIGGQYLPIEAKVIDPCGLALHRVIDVEYGWESRVYNEDCTFSHYGKTVNRAAWVVTHISSGLAVAYESDFRRAKKLLKTLSAMDVAWAHESPQHEITRDVKDSILHMGIGYVNAYARHVLK